MNNLHYFNITFIYRKTNELGDREATDARNSPDRPADFATLCANLYNDPEFNPSTTIYPDLHPNFTKPINLNEKDCPGITPQKVKSKIAESRAKVALLANAWHQSGNGDSQLVQQEDDERFGHFETDLIDGDDRASFLPVGGKPHHLYMWALFDDYHILHYTMAMLPKEFSVSSSHVPLVSNDADTRKKRRKDDIDKMTLKTQKAISKSIASLAKSGDKYILLEKKTYMDNIEIKLLTCDDTNVALKEALKKQFEAAVADYERHAKNA